MARAIRHKSSLAPHLDGWHYGFCTDLNLTHDWYAAILTNAVYVDPILEWCKSNCESRSYHRISNRIWYFKYLEDIVAFKLTWGYQ